MTYLLLLRKFWLPLTVAVVVISAGLYYGHTRFESGYAASEAHYTPLIAAAERARDAANLKAARQQEDSKTQVLKLEAEHDADVASLTLRVADSGQRIHDLSLRIAAASASRCTVPEARTPASSPDAASEVSQRAQEGGDSLIRVAADAESDAAQVIRLQEYITGQLAILQR